MHVYAIGDLHLSHGVPGKEMDRFGPLWANHPKPLAEIWDATITSEDLVLIPGDISWAGKLELAKPDFDWIEARPGTKVMIRGNHDYWWDSISKLRKALPPSLHAIQNDTFIFKDIAICGSRLWDSSEYSFSSIIDFKGPLEKQELDEALFERELLRLEMSLKLLPKDAKVKIAMTHYPPIGLNLEPSRTSKLLEEYGVSTCVFGHLHGIRSDVTELFGTARGVRYILTACDWLRSTPIKIL